MPARFDNSAAVQLHVLLEEDEQGTFLRHGEECVRPPRVDEPLAYTRAGSA
jgi:hypothetical protein